MLLSRAFLEIGSSRLVPLSPFNTHSPPDALSPMSQSRTYRSTGIILKTMPLGEADKIATILTKDFGSIRAVAKGARKQTSPLRGRTELFAINEFVIVRGRSLDRLSQVDTIRSLSGLRGSLAQLTVAQYWAEVTLMQALSAQSQEELYLLLVEHLDRLETTTRPEQALPLLVHGLYHLLAIAGIAPQVLPCGQCPGRAWTFSPDAGGVACEHCWASQRPLQRSPLPPPVRTVLKLLPKPELPQLEQVDRLAWMTVERFLRKSIQYHFDRTIQSAMAIDTCFPPTKASTSSSINSSTAESICG